MPGLLLGGLPCELFVKGAGLDCRGEAMPRAPLIRKSGTPSRWTMGPQRPRERLGPTFQKIALLRRGQSRLIYRTETLGSPLA